MCVSQLKKKRPPGPRGEEGRGRARPPRSTPLLWPGDSYNPVTRTCILLKQKQSQSIFKLACPHQPWVAVVILREEVLSQSAALKLSNRNRLRHGGAIPRVCVNMHTTEYLYVAERDEQTSPLYPTTFLLRGSSLSAIRVRATVE